LVYEWEKELYLPKEQTQGVLLDYVMELLLGHLLERELELKWEHVLVTLLVLLLGL
jgi:hypothetical protein